MSRDLRILFTSRNTQAVSRLILSSSSHIFIGVEAADFIYRHQMRNGTFVLSYGISAFEVEDVDSMKREARLAQTRIQYRDSRC